MPFQITASQDDKGWKEPLEVSIPLSALHRLSRCQLAQGFARSSLEHLQVRKFNSPLAIFAGV